MTAKLPFTQAALRRAIAAAQKEGYTVKGIRFADGTSIVLDNGENVESTIVSIAPDGQAKWEDIEV